MPFNADQLAYAGIHSINHDLRNKPIDQHNVERPFLKWLLANKSEWTGGLQYIIEKLRTSNSSNFQSYFGDQQVTYNKKRTLNEAKFNWGGFHDGFTLNEDELTQNSIILTDDRDAVPSGAEREQLVNIMKENTETLRLGFEEEMDVMLHRDGTQSVTDIAGLDALVDLTPAVGVVGGIDSATNPSWRNYANTAVAVTPGAVVEAVEDAWRETMRVGGSPPDFYMAGTNFYDAYRADANEMVNRQINVSGKGGTSVDAGTTGVYFKGKEIIWNPVFDILDTRDAPAIPWADRLYMLNSRHLKLKPIKGHWMIARRPPRVYDRYSHFWALTSKASLTTNKRSSLAVLALA